jgi:hypothetical protein
VRRAYGSLGCDLGARSGQGEGRRGRRRRPGLVAAAAGNPGGRARCRGLGRLAS